MLCSTCETELLPKAVKCPACNKPVTKKGQPLKRFQNYSNYGVGRDIPDAVKKQVRRECGFGCVLDGKMIVQYDHFEPEFVELKEAHTAGGIALLCPDCHVRKLGNSPQLTNTMVSEYRKNPYALKTGKASYPQFFLPPGPKYFRMGKKLLEAQELLFCTAGGIWLAIKQPSDANSPVMIDATFKMQSGQTLLRLEENVLYAYPSDGFDFREQSSSIAFSFKGEPILALNRSDHETMEILHAESWFNNYHIQITDFGIRVNGLPVFSGDGSLEIRATGSMNFELDKMYKNTAGQT